MAPDRTETSKLDATRTSLMSSATLRNGQELAGRYRIEDTVGVGAMGTVYRALDTRLGIEIALKVLHSSVAQDAEARQRFESELTLARQVSHRNVVRIHDIGEHEDLSFLTMDLVAGKSLADILLKEGALAPARAARIAGCIASGLAAAHAKGVIHRDLKPGNILVDEDDNALITDFGVALSLAAARVTRTGFFVGTPHYLSPEQARGDTVDGRADIYALGLILYEMLAGRSPFEAASLDELLAQRTHGRAPNLSRDALPAPEYLRRIIAKCLKKRPSDRYANAADVAADLSHGRAPRRFSRWWTTAAAVIVAVIVGAGAALVLIGRPPGGGVVDAVPPVQQAPVTLAILPFRDEPADPALAWISTGVIESLTAELSVSQQVTIVDKQRVSSTLSDLRIQPGAPAPAVSRQLAALFGADWILGGTLTTASGRVEINAVMLPLDDSAAPRPLPPVSASLAEFSELSSALAHEIRQSLSLPVPAARPMRLSENLEALRAYAIGVDLLARGDSLGAQAQLEVAVKADEAFAAAWLKLAEAYDALGRTKDAASAAERAVSESGDAGTSVAKMARVRQAELAGDLDAARELLSKIIDGEPGDSSARLMLAELTGDNGLYGEAIELLETLVADDPNHPRAWFLLGKFSIQNGDSQRALSEYLVNALAIQERLENDQGKADALNAIGIAQHRMGRLQEAQKSYQQAAQLRGAIDDKRGYASSLANVARVKLQLGLFDEARAALDQSIAVRRELGDQPGLATLLNIYGVLEEEQGNFQAALQRFRSALQIREDSGDRRAMGNSYNNIGFAYFMLGEYDNAGVYWRQALEQSLDTDNPDVEMQARQNLGQLKLAQGEWAASLDLFLNSLEVSRKLGYPDAEAVALGNLGRVAQRQGRFDAALASYADALAIVEAIDDSRGIIEFRLWRADAWLELGLAASAESELSKAAERLEQTSNDEQRATLQSLRGTLLAQRGEHERAQAQFDAAEAAAERTGSPVSLLRARLSRAESTRSGEVQKAEALAMQAQAFGDADLSMRASYLLARELLASGAIAAASKAVDQLLFDLGTHSPYSRAWQINLLASDVMEANGRSDAATRAMAQALDEVQRLVAGMPATARDDFRARPIIARVLTQ